MVDVVDHDTRSRMMASIKNKNTSPEMIVRRMLHGEGYRYRLHGSKLPGRPDLVLRKYTAVIFVNGCFWHGHQCHLFKWPKTRPEFWKTKINGNVTRDEVTLTKLKKMGWRVCRVWECAVKGKTKRNPEDIAGSLVQWLGTSNPELEICGDPVDRVNI